MRRMLLNGCCVALASATALADSLVIPANEDVMTSGFFIGEDAVRGYAGDNRPVLRVSTDAPFGVSGAETIYVSFDYDFGGLAAPVDQALLTMQSVSGGFGADADPNNPFTVAAHALTADPFVSIADNTNPGGPIDWLSFYENNIAPAAPEAVTIVDGFGEVTFDITAVVNDWISGANGVFAIALTGRLDTSGGDFLHGFLNNSDAPGSTYIEVVPEPTSLLLLLTGALAIGRRR